MKNVKLLRERARMSQHELGAVLFISQQSVCKYERGISQPSNLMLRKMSDFFEVPVDILINDDISIDEYMDEKHTDITNREERLLHLFRKMNDEHKKTVEGLVQRISKLNIAYTKERTFDKFGEIMTGE